MQLDRVLDTVIGTARSREEKPSLLMLPMRLFFGVTFLYAGLQKLTDPQFFSATAPGFIGRQMSGYVRSGSPLSPILTHLAIPHPTQFGALIAFCELWVGLATLLGLLARIGAFGGMLISVTLFLTATWNVHPYFLGSDLPYAVGWLTLGLAGPGLYSLDEYFFGEVFRRRFAPPPLPATRRAGKGSGKAVPALPIARDPLARAGFLRGIGTALGVIIGGGIIGGIAKVLTPTSSSATGGVQMDGAGTAPAANVAAPAGTTFIGNVKTLALNSAGQYTDPASGDPALLVHLPNGQFVAYDAVCTHAGCTVEYDPSQHMMVCPCHGATFDPANQAAVLAGPTGQPLSQLRVTVDSKGNAFAQG